MTMLGYFSKILAKKILTKVAKVCGNFLGSFEKWHYQSKNSVDYYLGYFLENGGTFYSQILSHCPYQNDETSGEHDERN